MTAPFALRDVTLSDQSRMALLEQRSRALTLSVRTIHDSPIAAAPTEDTTAAFFQRHFAPSDAAQWQQMTTRLTREVDPQDYDRAWRTLADDIKAALPLAPDSPHARQLLKRWDALLAPFMRVASGDQQRLARTMWQNVDQRGEAHNQPVTPQIIDFVNRARAAQPASKKRKRNAQPRK